MLTILSHSHKFLHTWAAPSRTDRYKQAYTLPRLGPVSHILHGSLPPTGTVAGSESTFPGFCPDPATPPVPTHSTHSSCYSQITSPRGRPGRKQGILGARLLALLWAA